jgi:hypothetical protein
VRDAKAALYMAKKDKKGSSDLKAESEFKAFEHVV